LSAALTFGSVCSGIEAASVAFTPIGWKAAWLSEIDPFACKLLKHHYPDVPNLGDMTTLPERILAGEVPAPDVFCGGTPCQAFSVAGLRGSLDDARGNLTLTFCEIANAIDTVRSSRDTDPCVVVYENVVGLLSVADNAFGCLLGALAGEDEALEPAGGKWSHAGCVFGPQRAVAWRVLDAQHFGVPQRRRRLIVVACPLERAHPTAILFELESGDWNPQACGDQAQVDSGLVEGGTGEDGVEQPYAVANCLTRRMHKGINTTLDEGQTPILAYVKGTNPHSKDECPTFREAETAACLNGWDARHNPPKHLVGGPVVRVLMPIEAERLMGFPDNYTDIPGVSDTARYKALGNSWAVPMFNWIGRRINAQIGGGQ
jgi:DNA (cytosine-5)-methyltransferase 1